MDFIIYLKNAKLKNMKSNIKTNLQLFWLENANFHNKKKLDKNHLGYYLKKSFTEF